MDDLGLDAGFVHLVLDALNVDGVLVCQVVVEVEGLFCLLAFLLVSEYQIDP